MLSWDGRVAVSPSPSLPNEPAFHALPFHASSADPATSESTWFNASPMRSTFPSPNCSSRRRMNSSMTTSWCVAQLRRRISLSTPTRSSMRSTKPPDDRSGGTAEPGGREWRVRFHPKVAKLIARYDADDPSFRPTLGALRNALATNPKQFEKKSGKLRPCRAAALSFADGVSWRAVFKLDEPARVVNVLSLAPHDAAYAEAVRRL